MKGLFVTLEGPEGSGKTTQIQRICQSLEEHSFTCKVIREPGGTPVGDLIRHILLDPNVSEITVTTEVLLYAASRAQLVEQVIRPALLSHDVVLCDRYVDSSIVYQGYGAQWDVEAVMEINRIATGGLLPDRTYLLDIPEDQMAVRLEQRGQMQDRMESKGKSFHRKVREGYLCHARKEPQRFRIVDGTLDITQVSKQIMDDLLVRLSGEVSISV